MRVRIHPEAVADLASAGDWYNLQRSGLGGDLADEVDRALAAIFERPTAWPLWPGIGEAVGIRRFLLPRFPFAVGYLVEADEIVVLALAHLRRRPGFWVERLSVRP